MNNPLDQFVCWICDYWWVILLLIVIVATLFLTRDYWLPYWWEMINQNN